MYNTWKFHELEWIEYSLSRELSLKHKDFQIVG